ncbi:hypothetical protein Ssed_2267 [Shewanella sediminis HAW-EB3]|uniref:Uncharacterized protein n=1 Tax=Shewanella sediminis (strain HAW-EB3) TaxID=425104 RepID=A8FVK3_SHESH|nr:hypothetical protein [Shewanella sediminis]ABV36876.1 hypothetical protein Ssed_2267 [Shewanella sediminis HAW-EB3]
METDINKLHQGLFPEEYDFVYDSYCDALARKRGINPMSQVYQDEVNERRRKLGVRPYECEDSSSCNSSDNTSDSELISSMEYCRILVNSMD